nr:MAG TPA: hypothetical protein [Caudoviricetes sp.]
MRGEIRSERQKAAPRSCLPRHKGPRPTAGH